MTQSWQSATLLLGALLAVVSAGLGASMPGAPVEADVNDPSLRNALQLAVAEHNRKSDGLFLSQVSKVVRAQTQVVAGIMYIFEVEMVHTKCRKDDVKTVCDAHPDPELAKPYTCEFHVWSRPWLNSIQVAKNNCNN